MRLIEEGNSTNATNNATLAKATVDLESESYLHGPDLEDPDDSEPGEKDGGEPNEVAIDREMMTDEQEDMGDKEEIEKA